MQLKVLMQCHKITVRCHSNNLLSSKLVQFSAMQFLTAEFIATDK